MRTALLASVLSLGLGFIVSTRRQSIGKEVFSSQQRIDDLLFDDDEGKDEIDSYEAQKRWTLSNEELTKTTGEGNAFADSRVMDLAVDYNFPLSYIADMIVSLGARPPIRDADRISDLLDGEQAFALLEALTSLDGAEVESMYFESTLEDLAYLMDVPVDELFTACADRGFSLPHGLQTQLRRDQVAVLRSTLDDEGQLGGASSSSPFSMSPTMMQRNTQNKNEFSSQTYDDEDQ